MTTSPYVSLSIICGDEGARTLGRLLSSVVNRPDGCMVDEICIAWNGLDDGLLEQAMGPYARKLPEIGQQVEQRFVGGGSAFTISILHQEWKKDFAIARNEAFAMCRGEWIIWADTDDVIANAADNGKDGLPALNAVARRFGVPERSADGSGAPSHSLSQWLALLPWSVNLICAPYDYAIGEHGEAIVRQWVRRIVRRSAGWIWRSPDGAHEVLYPTGGVPMTQVHNPGLLFRHYPVQPVEQRIERNAQSIVAKLTETGTYVDARHAYDVASVHLAAGQLEEVDAAIRAAIATAANDSDIYRYRCFRANVAIQRGTGGTTGLQEAFSAISLFPERAEAYYIAAECFFLMHRMEACAQWYELGLKQPALPQDIELCGTLYTKPHAQGAEAYLQLGKHERALEAITLGLRDYPHDPMLNSVAAKVRAALLRERAISGALDLLEYLAERRDWYTAKEILGQTVDSPALRGIAAVQRMKLITARIGDDKDDGWRPGAQTPEEQAFLDAQPEDAEVLFLRGHLSDLTDVLYSRPWNFAELSDGSFARSHRSDLPERRHVVLYAPHAVQPWDPTTPETHGIGGSESAVAYLAFELARRGYRVDVYCPGGKSQPQLRDGVAWWGLNVFDPANVEGDVLISCRAPWILREPKLTIPTFVWHQDNGYGNEWSWNKELYERAAGHLMVSQWAGRQLLSEIGVEASSARWSRLGNGVKPEWCLVNRDPATLPQRDPHRVIYASDPTRGLDTLLNCWPSIVREFPDAKLDLYCDFRMASMVNGLVPGAVEGLRKMQEKIRELNGGISAGGTDELLPTYVRDSIHSHGWIGQSALTEEMLRAGVYAYPGGPMPEGYGVALAQAAAAGMIVVYPAEGALPEIHGRAFEVPPVKSEEAAHVFRDTVVHAMRYANEDDYRCTVSGNIARLHTWDKVADRLEKLFEEVLK